MNSKLIDENERRLEVITVIETYYIDFLTRVRDYGIEENLNIPNVKASDDDHHSSQTPVALNQSKPDLAKMNRERDEKIRRYKEKKELDSQLKQLKASVIEANKAHRDEEIVRKYYLKLIHSFVLSTLDEISSYEMEKPILQHLTKVKRGEVAATEGSTSQPKRPLKPIIITRDAVQKQVFGMGYKHLPVLSIEEFYEQRVRDGWFPSQEQTKKQNSLMNRAMTDSDAAKRQENDEARLVQLKLNPVLQKFLKYVKSFQLTSNSNFFALLD